MGERVEYRHPMVLLLTLMAVGVAVFLGVDFGLSFGRGDIYQVSLTLGGRDTFYIMYMYAEDVSSIAQALFDEINSTCREVEEYGRLYISINESIYQVMGKSPARFLPASTASSAPSIDLARCEFFYQVSPLKARAYLRTITGGKPRPGHKRGAH